MKLSIKELETLSQILDEDSQFEEESKLALRIKKELELKKLVEKNRK